MIPESWLKERLGDEPTCESSSERELMSFGLSDSDAQELLSRVPIAAVGREVGARFIGQMATGDELWSFEESA